MIERPDPEKLLAGPLGHWLDEQAILRAQAKNLAWQRWWKAGMILGPLLLMLWIIVPGWFQFNMFVTLGSAGAAWAWGNAPRAEAMKRVKIGINQAIAQALQLTYENSVGATPAFDLARAYEMVPNFDRSSFEDQWLGDIGKRSFLLHEAHLEERRESDKTTHYVTVFRGAIVQIDFARNFHGATLVERAKTHRRFFGGRKETIKLDGKTLRFVDLVHPDFEDQFCVYSDDQVEARYLVHPEYVERLMGVQHAFAGQAIRTLFSGGKLVIVVETENMFESGSIDAADDRSRLARTIDQFAAIADLAQTLNEPERGIAAAQAPASPATPRG